MESLSPPGRSLAVLCASPAMTQLLTQKSLIRPPPPRCARHSLLVAYGAVGARRNLQRRGDSSFYASSVVSSSSASSNSISLSKTWPSSPTSPRASSMSNSD